MLGITPLDKHTFSIVRAPPCLKPVLMPTHLETLQAPNIWDRGEKWGVMLLPQTVSMPSFSPVHIYPFKSIWNLWFPSLFPVERYQPLAATLYRNFSFPSLFCYYSSFEQQVLQESLHACCPAPCTSRFSPAMSLQSLWTHLGGMQRKTFIFQTSYLAESSNFQILQRFG